MASNDDNMHHLYYFDLGGRAEPIRICLHAAGIPFEDHRIAFADWPAQKDKMPLQCIPILKLPDGTTFTQSMSLARYAAKKAGLYPTGDDYQALIVDEIMDACNELQNTVPAIVLDDTADVEEREAARVKWQKETLSRYAQLMEDRIQSSGTSTSVVKEPSVADLIVLVVVENTQKGIFSFIDRDYFGSYPGIMATCKKIRSHPKVVAYYERQKEKSPVE